MCTNQFALSFCLNRRSRRLTDSAEIFAGSLEIAACLALLYRHLHSIIPSSGDGGGGTTITGLGFLTNIGDI
jgi:hypothetical protein